MHIEFVDDSDTLILKLASNRSRLCLILLCPAPTHCPISLIDVWRGLSHAQLTCSSPLYSFLSATTWSVLPLPAGHSYLCLLVTPT